MMALISGGNEGGKVGNSKKSHSGEFRGPNGMPFRGRGVRCFSFHRRLSAGGMIGGKSEGPYIHVLRKKVDDVNPYPGYFLRVRVGAPLFLKKGLL